LIVEAQAIERAAWVWSVLYRSEGRLWRRLNTGLIALAAILAAISSGAGFSQATTRAVAAAIAAAAAATAALGSALSAGTRASNAEAAATSDMALADAARAFYLTVAPYVTTEEAVAGFERLCAQRDQVVASTPITHLPFRRGRLGRLWTRADTIQKRRLAEVTTGSADLTGTVEQPPS